MTTNAELNALRALEMMAPNIRHIAEVMTRLERRHVVVSSTYLEKELPILFHCSCGATVPIWLGALGEWDEHRGVTPDAG